MGELTYDAFAAFFRALWGFDPFPWQEDLLRRLATGKDPRRHYDDLPGVWPSVLDLPTGSGKTAALDIAVYHLALEARRGDKRRAPARIAFVVDRRLIVDDAYGRGRFIARALGWSLLGDSDATKVEAELAADEPPLMAAFHRVRASAVVKQVALRLRQFSGYDRPPLVARALRGGAPREDDWAQTPAQPTILCSTVDQVGSRLLFRGYGVSDSMKSIHAGLLGSDCLLLLDEAHLSEPFRQTLAAVERLRAPDDAPFGFSVLTATPSQRDKQPFALSTADETHPILSRRITTPKPARLIEINARQGIDADARRAEVFVEQARLALHRLIDAGIAHPAVGIIVNRVGRARAIHTRLLADLNGMAKVILLIGPARAVDRDSLARELEPIRTGRDEARQQMTMPLLVVATQAIEAGVDIDFDGIVTEAAAFDALKQRFGRLNRAARDIRPDAVILAYKDDISAKADDPVYGDRIRLTWEKLQQLAPEKDRAVDFGIAALTESIRQDEAVTLAAPTRHAPVLMPAYADLWSQTSPIPSTVDPEVALFLHGPDRSRASVQVVWRADIDGQNDLRPAMEDEGERERLIELFNLVPPRAAEAIEVPLWAARAWLEQVGTRQADFSDTVERRQEVDGERGAGQRAFRWAGDDNDRKQSRDKNNQRSGVVYASALRDGDLIVVPADYGGCDAWGWKPDSSTPVIDVAEIAAVPFRARRLAVRVTPELILQGRQLEQTGHGEVAFAEIEKQLSEVLRTSEGDRANDILAAASNLEFLPRGLREGLATLQRLPAGKPDRRREGRRGPLEILLSYRRDAEDRPRGIVFLAPRGVEATNGGDAALPVTESDDLSVVTGRAIPLLEHSRHVRDWVDDFALRAGLPKSLREDVVLSGYLHDTGKADPRWQTYVTGGDPFGPDAQDLLAKSERRLPAGVWGSAGLPPNWRHEALSVRIAMVHPDFAQAHDPELVLWLIGTHHGQGRPLFPHADPRDAQDKRLELPGEFGGQVLLAAGRGPQSLAFNFKGQDWAQLFDKLKRRYGIWGLARLEAFVRLADHRASEHVASPRTPEPYEEAAE